MPVSREFDVNKFPGYWLVCPSRHMDRRAARLFSGMGVTGTRLGQRLVARSERSGRNYLAGQQGDAVLAAAGYNFSLLLRWRKALLGLLIAALKSQPKELEA